MPRDWEASAKRTGRAPRPIARRHNGMTEERKKGVDHAIWLVRLCMDRAWFTASERAYDLFSTDRYRSASLKRAPKEMNIRAYGRGLDGAAGDGR